MYDPSFLEKQQAWMSAEEAQVNRDSKVAAERWRRFLSLDPNSAAGHTNLSFCLVNTGNPEEALSEARIAYKLEPEEWGPRAALLQALDASELLAELRQEAERQSKSYPTDFHPWEFRGRVALQDGSHDTAEHYFKKAVELKPDANFAWMHLGSIYIYTRRFEEALDAFGKAQASVHDRPGPPQLSQFEALIGMCWSLLYMNKPDRALILAEQAEGLGVNAGAAKRIQAQCKFALQRSDAVSTARDAIRLGAGDGYLHMALAAYYAESGKISEARQIVDSVDAGPDSYARNLRAGVLARLGRTEEALQELDSLEGELPEYVRQNSLGTVHMFADNFPKAKEHLAVAVDHRRDEVTLNNMGKVCLHLGELDEAETFFRQALDLYEDFPSSLLLMAYLYAEKDQESRARQVAKRVLDSELAPTHFKTDAAELLSRIDDSEARKKWFKANDAMVTPRSSVEGIEQLLQHYASQRFEDECCRVAVDKSKKGFLRWSSAHTRKVLRHAGTKKEIDVYGHRQVGDVERLCLGECKLRITSTAPINYSEINELVRKISLAREIEGTSGRAIEGYFFTNVEYEGEARQLAEEHGIRFFTAKLTKNWQQHSSWTITKLISSGP